MNISTTINIVIAIGVHKSIAGSSLGIALVKNFPEDFKFVKILVFCFSIASPIGIIVGMILGAQSDIYEIIFSSMAAGTFLYIACSEVIVEEFSLPGYRWLKLFAFLCGSALILGIWFLPGS